MFDGPISLFYNRCCFGSDFFLPRLGLNCEDVRFIRGYISPSKEKPPWKLNLFFLKIRLKGSINGCRVRILQTLKGQDD